MSPDRRWVAYTSNESGRNEVFVRPFAGAGGGERGGRWQVSTNGGVAPQWRRDGKELFFRDQVTGAPMAAAVSATEAAFEAGVPHQLFVTSVNQAWAAAKDGQRFLVSAPPRATLETPLTVVLNWTSALARQPAEKQ